MKIKIMFGLIITCLLIFTSCSNMFEPEVKYKDRVTYVTNTVTNYVDPEGNIIISNSVEYNHDQYYLVNSSFYQNEYVCFYFTYVKTNREVIIYYEVSGVYIPIPNYDTNYLIEDNWAKLLDPTSNYMGKWMQVKVLWEEWEYEFTNL